MTNEAGITGRTCHTSAGTNNQLSGFGYDAAGNITSNNPAPYVCDAENRLLWTSAYRYLYDSDGQVVRQIETHLGSPEAVEAHLLYQRTQSTVPIP